MVVAVAAILGGGATLTAFRLGLAMTLLQASIGVLNDLVDAPRDVGRTPPKPIPAGLVTPRLARAMVVAGAVAGVVLAAPSGPSTIGLCVVVLLIGYGYDLALKGTAWSWLPFAIGIPILPLFGWFGAGVDGPRGASTLVAAAIVAGAGLAIANSRADHEQDLQSGTRSVATALGLERSWWVGTALLVAVIAIAAVAVLGPAAEVRPSTGPLAVGVTGAALILVGSALGWRSGPRRRERAWQCQAVGVAVLATGYLAGVAVAPG